MNVDVSHIYDPYDLNTSKLSSLKTFHRLFGQYLFFLLDFSDVVVVVFVKVVVYLRNHHIIQLVVAMKTMDSSIKS